MAEATTRPRTRRTSGSATAGKSVEAKATNVKAAEAPTEAEAPDTKKRTQLELDALEPSKSYAKFAPPEGSGCVGTLYAPLGTKTVKVLLIADE